MKLPFTRVEGEAAFYGPKLDFMFRDSLGREWQLATIQVDFVQPERFELEYTTSSGQKDRPVMIHRAIAGSLERFLSVIIEHFAGAFPLWLAPTQAVILPVNDAHDDFAKNLAQKISAEKNGRIEIWDSSRETLGKRLRESQIKKIPLAIIVGDEEVGGGDLAIRRYGARGDEKISAEKIVKRVLKCPIFTLIISWREWLKEKFLGKLFGKFCVFQKININNNDYCFFEGQGIRIITKPKGDHFCLYNNL